MREREKEREVGEVGQSLKVIQIQLKLFFTAASAGFKSTHKRGILMFQSIIK